MPYPPRYYGENDLDFLTASARVAGQRVEDDQSDGQGRPMQHYYPRDIFGERTGIWDDHSIAGWVGWDIYWSQVAGQRLNMGGSSAYIDHADAVGSTTMETDPAGGEKQILQLGIGLRMTDAARMRQLKRPLTRLRTSGTLSPRRGLRI